MSESATIFTFPGHKGREVTNFPSLLSENKHPRNLENQRRKEKGKGKKRTSEVSDFIELEKGCDNEEQELITHLPNPYKTNIPMSKEITKMLLDVF